MENLLKIVLKGFLFGIGFVIGTFVIYAAGSLINSVTEQKINKGDKIGSGWFQDVNNKIISLIDNQTTISGEVSYNTERLNEIFRIGNQMNPGKSCKDILDTNPNTAGQDGIYWIDPDGEGGVSAFEVYCDMTTDGGGWILVVYNNKPTTFTNFNKDWSHYKNGFGDLANQNLGWIGNDNLHYLTNNSTIQLKVQTDLYNHYYNDWNVSSESDNYKMTFDKNNSPNTNDGGRFSSTHNGMLFTTYDRDNDNSSSNCASDYRSGWWYSSCYSMTHAGNNNGHVYWRDSSGDNYNVNWIKFWIR